MATEKVMDRVERLLAERGWKWAELARRLGYSEQRLYNWRRRGMPPGEAGPVAAVFGVTIDYILAGSGPRSRSGIGLGAGAPAAGALERRLTFEAGEVPRHRAWVVGDTLRGVGEVRETGGPPTEWVAVYHDDEEVYALRVRGRAGGQRIREGDVISLSPGAVPSPGDEVLVKLVGGEVLLATLVLSTSLEVTVAELAEGAARRVIPVSEVEYCHAVVGIYPASQVRRT